jgi:mannose/fructose-specific phosphotransferase system component IIA
VSAPPVNNDGSGSLPDLDLQNKIDLQSLLAKKKKSFEVVEGKNTTLTFDLMLERERATFRSSCKVAANQVVASLNITISTLKEAEKNNEKLKHLY